MQVPDIVIRLVGSALSLYMLLILLNWLGSWIDIDVRAGRLRWIGRATDPLIRLARRILPPMGPFDFAPIAALFAVWVVKLVSLTILLNFVTQQVYGE